jgi:hypothetical protein
MNSAFQRSTDSYLTEDTETYIESDACTTLCACASVCACACALQTVRTIEFNLHPLLIVQSIGNNSLFIKSLFRWEFDPIGNTLDAYSWCCEFETLLERTDIFRGLSQSFWQHVGSVPQTEPHTRFHSFSLPVITYHHLTLRNVSISMAIVIIKVQG